MNSQDLDRAAETFAEATDFTVGVEEEFSILDPQTLELVPRFEELRDAAASDAVLGDAVCGELISSEIEIISGVGIDLHDPKLQAEWTNRERPNLEFRAEEATSLSFGDDEFDMACAIEVLEHVPDPGQTLSEMARVARRWMLVSVPREPLWRILNMARGAYLRDLGNTPGHVNHWSKVGFCSLLQNYGKVHEVRKPFPWTMVLVDVGSS